MRRALFGSGSTVQSSVNLRSQPAIRVVVDVVSARRPLVVSQAAAVRAINPSPIPVTARQILPGIRCTSRIEPTTRVISILAARPLWRKINGFANPGGRNGVRPVHGVPVPGGNERGGGVRRVDGADEGCRGPRLRRRVARRDPLPERSVRARVTPRRGRGPGDLDATGQDWHRRAGAAAESPVAPRRGRGDGGPSDEGTPRV